jgi:flagellar protein FlaG
MQIDSHFNNQYDQSKENEQKDKAAEANLLKSAISNANNKLKFKRTKCEFTIYEDINRIAIKVIDRDTEEVIREIPPEETMELVQKLWEFAGLIVDEKR